jgi:hypothetical protein
LFTERYRRDNTFTAFGTNKCFDARESQEGVQRSAMGTAGATNLGGFHFRQGSRCLFEWDRAYHCAAFVTGEIDLIPACNDNKAAATVHLFNVLVRNDVGLAFYPHDSIISLRSGTVNGCEGGGRSFFR